MPAKGLQGPVSTTEHSLSHRVPAEVADQFTQSSAPRASWQDVGGGRAGWSLGTSLGRCMASRQAWVGRLALARRMRYCRVVRRERRPAQRGRPARVGLPAVGLLALLDVDLDQSLVEQLVGYLTECHGSLQSPRAPAVQLAV